MFRRKVTYIVLVASAIGAAIAVGLYSLSCTEPPERQRREFAGSATLKIIERPRYSDLRVFSVRLDLKTKAFTFMACNETGFSLVQPSAGDYTLDREGNIRFDPNVNFSVAFENGAKKPGTLTGTNNVWLLKKEGKLTPVYCWSYSDRPKRLPEDGQSTECSIQEISFAEEKTKDRQALWLEFITKDEEDVAFVILPQKAPSLPKPPSSQPNSGIANPGISNITYGTYGTLNAIEPPPFSNLRVYVEEVEVVDLKSWSFRCTLKAFNDSGFSLLKASSAQYDPCSLKMKFDSAVKFSVQFENGAKKPGTVTGSSNFWVFRKGNDLFEDESLARGGRPFRLPADGEKITYSSKEAKEKFSFARDRSKDRQSLLLNVGAKYIFLILPERDPKSAKFAPLFLDLP